MSDTTFFAFFTDTIIEDSCAAQEEIYTLVFSLTLSIGCILLPGYGLLLDKFDVHCVKILTMWVALSWTWVVTFKMRSCNRYYQDKQERRHEKDTATNAFFQLCRLKKNVLCNLISQNFLLFSLIYLGGMSSLAFVAPGELMALHWLQPLWIPSPQRPWTKKLQLAF